eukprot:TRINITY_DN8475_c0_g1_i1.p1 TRINITY_DN8475_c0_g1~~TRINITY_DN8475_c0_g1_i1.p1  ORF type:complete len:335 (-),score=63.77 TRINITY_DN8475_c0_g1_i1:74-1078(-)
MDPPTQNEYINKLVKFVDKKSHKKYGICQYLGEVTTSYINRDNVRSMNHFKVDDFNYVFRTGKDINNDVIGDYNYSPNDKSTLLQIKSKMSCLPGNFIFYYKHKSESNGPNYQSLPVFNLLNTNILNISHLVENDIDEEVGEDENTKTPFPLLPSLFVLVDERTLKNEFKINELPNSVWPIILSYFKTNELPQLNTVCKKWKNHCENDFHWKKRLEVEYSWMDKLPEKDKEKTWKQQYLDQDFQINIQQVDRNRNNLVMSSHTVKISPNSSLKRLVNVIQNSLGEHHNFKLPHEFFSLEISANWNPDSKSVRESGLKNGSVLNFAYEPPKMYCD